jgi:DivIVA domain-containing protein
MDTNFGSNSDFFAPDTDFRRTLFRPGYAVDEVDPFVEVVDDALRSVSPRLGARDVAGREFTQVMLKPGYRIEDVDDYLDQSERWLHQREREG